jgi:imidazole glycerol-phosphate synthase subunit HisH
MTIGIINYGIAGNVYSIKKAVEKAGGTAFVINARDDFDQADKIIIPGVGSFKDAMNELKNNDFIEPIKKYNKPILGICLGMQILSTIGDEFGRTKGLDIINAEVKLLRIDAVIPHLGFNTINVLKSNKLLKGVEHEEFYFMHSYEVTNANNIISTTAYMGYSFISSIQKGNVYGVQFHPEKSRDAGIKLFKNFIKL